MTRSERAAVHRLLRAGRGLLRKGLPREAADVFGRVLLKEPRRGAARRGLARARHLAAEETRVQEARLAEAQNAVDAPQRIPARRAALRFHRQDAPAGSALERRQGHRSISSRSESTRPSFGETALAIVSRRRTLIVLCAAAYAMLVGIAMLHWEDFVKNLVRTPAPIGREAEPPLISSGRTRGERAVAEALCLIEKGDPTSALSMLEAIPQADPAYPFSQHLRRRLSPARAEP